MSILVDARELTDDNKTNIYECLMFKRKPKKKMRGKFIPGPPVKFYMKESEFQAISEASSQAKDRSVIVPGEDIKEDSNSKEKTSNENLYRIPFSFANVITGSYKNAKLERPDIALEFRGKLRDHQVPVVERAMRYLKDYCSTTLGLYTGFGKTVTAAYLSCHLKKRICILYPATALGPQWEKVFKDNTNCSTWLVGESKEKTSKPTSSYIPDVIICLDERWQKIPEYLRDMVGTLVVDEAHMFCTETAVPCILAFRPQYLIQCTATPTREDELHLMLWSLGGMHIIYTIYDRPFVVMKINTGIRPSSKMKGPDFHWSEYEHSILMNKDRNRIIMSIVRGDIGEHKVAALSTRKDHVKELYDISTQAGIPCDFMMGTKKGYKDSNFLIGSFSKIGVGFDEANFCKDYGGTPIDTIMVVGTVRSVSRLEQGVGRAFRAESPRIYHFVDEGKVFESQWKDVVPWYKQRKCIIIEYRVAFAGKSIFLEEMKRC